MAEITSVSFRRTFNIGNYESVGFEATVTLADDDVPREALEHAQRFVQDEFTRWREAHQAQPATSAPSPREPDAPASDKQRAYMDYLLKELSWDGERLTSFAAEHHLNVLTLTKREASELIDQLKAVLAGVDDAPATAVVQTDQSTTDAPLVEEQPTQRDIPAAERATPRQVRALERMAEQRNIDLAAELRARFGDRLLDELSMDEAGELLSEWQQRPRQPQPRQTAQKPA